MKIVIKILFLVTFISFTGCGGGGSSDTQESDSIAETPQESVMGILIDSPVIGVSYNCNDTSSVTSSQGEFTCPKDSKVTFSVGNILLGEIDLSTIDEIKYITPSQLYDLPQNDISDNRVLNFIRFLQSLDSDSNPYNGITVDPAINDKLKEYNLNLSQLSEDSLKNILSTLNKTLITANQALLHYTYTLENILNIELKEEPLYYQQWYLENNRTFYTQNEIDENASINAKDLLKRYRGEGVKIAVIDNGLDMEHEELQGSVIASYDIDTKTTDVSPTLPTEYHGTAVTGIIASRVNAKGIRGVASGADIIFLKYKDYMSDSEFIELFNKAEEFGADIINCSWGTYDVSESVRDKIVELSNDGRDGKGIVIVFASGNDGSDMGNDESAIPEVIAVGATQKENDLTSYSNYGPNLDLVAPGGYWLGITTTDVSGTNGGATLYEDYLSYNDQNYFIGTSASAPIVSGAIALMLEKNPNLTREEIANLFKTCCDKIGDIPYEDDRNDYFGYGKLNLSKCMDLID